MQNAKRDAVFFKAKELIAAPPAGQGKTIAVDPKGRTLKIDEATYFSQCVSDLFSDKMPAPSWVRWREVVVLVARG